MSPETIVTFGMLSTFLSIIIATWRLYRYIGNIEQQIFKNKQDIDGLAEATRRKNKVLLRHINNHCVYLTNIEEYLEKKLDYQPATKITLNESDL